MIIISWLLAQGGQPDQLPEKIADYTIYAVIGVVVIWIIAKASKKK